LIDKLSFSSEFLLEKVEAGFAARGKHFSYNYEAISTFRVSN